MSSTKIASPHAFTERGVSCVSFLHMVPHGITLKEVNTKAYFSNAWKVFDRKVNSTIDLLAEDGSWEAKARVVAAADGNVRLRILWVWEAEKVSVKLPEGVRVEFLSGQGWRAIDANGSIIVEGEPGEADAMLAVAARMPAVPQPAPAKAKATA